MTKVAFCRTKAWDFLHTCIKSIRTDTMFIFLNFQFNESEPLVFARCAGRGLVALPDESNGIPKTRECSVVLSPLIACSHGSCNFVFENEIALKKHVVAHHAKTRKNPDFCHLCNRSYASKYTLKRHMRDHHEIYTEKNDSVQTRAATSKRMRAVDLKM